MKETLIEILSQFVGDEVYLQGTMAEDQAYPDKFITYFTSGSDFESFYDNDPNRIDWTLSVIFYSSDPNEVLEIPPQIIRALRSEGFIPINAGMDVISDVISHTGWAMDFIYPEKYLN